MNYVARQDTGSHYRAVDMVGIKTEYFTIRSLAIITVFFFKYTIWTITSVLFFLTVFSWLFFLAIF